MKNNEREIFLEELRLRKLIQNSIKIVENQRRQKRLEESRLRNLIRALIIEASVADKIPHDKTAINLLEDMLKKIVPVLEDDYKIITTDPEQRASFRQHIMNAIENSIAPPRVNQRAPGDAQAQIDALMKEAPGLNFNVDPNDEVDMSPEDEEKFIDITSDGAEQKSEEEKFGAGLENLDNTGRNMAFNTFKKIESPIVNTYDLLDNNEDRAIFYEYLLTNVKLYFDRFEEELQHDLQEPTTDAYSAEKQRQSTLNPEAEPAV